MSTISDTATTLAFFATLASTRPLAAGVTPIKPPILEVPRELFSMGRVAAALIASTLPMPRCGPGCVMSAWLDRAAAVLGDVQHGSSTRGINMLCSPLFTVLSLDVEAHRGTLPRRSLRARDNAPVEGLLAELSRVERAVLADDLAGEFVVVPRAASEPWWRERIARARQAVDAAMGSTGVARRAGAILSAARRIARD